MNFEASTTPGSPTQWRCAELWSAMRKLTTVPSTRRRRRYRNKPPICFRRRWPPGLKYYFLPLDARWRACFVLHESLNQLSEWPAAFRGVFKTGQPATLRPPSATTKYYTTADVILCGLCSRIHECWNWTAAGLSPLAIMYQILNLFTKFFQDIIFPDPVPIA